MHELLLYLLHGYIEILCTRKIGVCESITDHNFFVFSTESVEIDTETARDTKF